MLLSLQWIKNVRQLLYTEYRPTINLGSSLNVISRAVSRFVFLILQYDLSIFKIMTCL